MFKKNNNGEVYDVVPEYGDEIVMEPEKTKMSKGKKAGLIAGGIGIIGGAIAAGIGIKKNKFSPETNDFDSPTDNTYDSETDTGLESTADSE